MEYREAATNDIDELREWFGHSGTFDGEIYQVSPGALDFRAHAVRLDDILIEWCSYGQSLIFREFIRNHPLICTTATKSPEGVKSRGHYVMPSNLVVEKPQEETELLISGGTHGFTVCISPELRDRLGWQLTTPWTLHVPPEHFQTLASVCWKITVAAQAARTAQEGADLAQVDPVLRDRLLSSLHRIFEPWRNASSAMACPARDPTRAYRLVKHAEELIARLPAEEKLEVSQLSAELEVAERTLYDAFQKWLGVGPYEYRHLCQLHEFRERLLADEFSHGAIQRAARASGFTHMGRLSQSYRRHFGETPRETRKRKFTDVTLR